MGDGQRFLTLVELAERWRCHPKTARRKGVPYTKPAGKLLYRLSDIERHEANTASRKLYRAMTA